MRNLMSALILLATALLAAGCEPSPTRLPSEREAVRKSLVWPQPPMRARIRFVRAVAKPVDLGIQPSFWQRVKRFIAGEEEKWFVRPISVAVREREIYVADPGAQAMWIIDAAAGRFQRIPKAGTEQLVSPVSVTPGPDGKVYLVDSFLRKVFVFSRSGKLVNTITSANLKRPTGLAYDVAQDRLYVADSAAHKIWIFTGRGKPLSSIGTRGVGNGEFNFPTHVAVDRKGTLFVTDSLGFRIQIFSPAGKFNNLFGRHGDASGDFARPKGVAIDSEDHVYVVEALFDAVQIFDRRGRYLLAFGGRGVGLGQFWLPGGIFIDPRNRIYVADAFNQRVQIFEFLPEGKR